MGINPIEFYAAALGTLASRGETAEPDLKIAVEFRMAIQHMSSTGFSRRMALLEAMKCVSSEVRAAENEEQSNAHDRIPVRYYRITSGGESKRNDFAKELGGGQSVPEGLPDPEPA